MPRAQTFALIGPIALCGLFTLVYATSPLRLTDSKMLGNVYRLYTQAFHVDDSGVVAIPSRFRWSVETSWRGMDVQGNNLPDSRVMLRLYDPNHNSTAFTAQMDLATAAKLHHELGDIIVKKLQNPHYQHRPQLYDPKDIPIGRMVGVDENGVAIVEFETNRTAPVPASREEKSTRRY